MKPETFSKPLIEWFNQNKRSLPFRETKDPYKIWVSEIMAQQTQIQTMLPYYKTWISKWPTIQDLATASDQEVKKAWEGLGYYRRAENLRKGAIYLVEEHQGIFPNEIEDIIKIPGIGDYTAGAISSIAFEQPEPAIDGNVIRVMSRVLEDDRDFLKAKNKKKLKATLKELMENVSPRVFTEGLMELGALICTPSRPKCQECPLQSICKANQNETTHLYPVKHRKTKQIELKLDTFLIVNNGYILISFDDSDGLMKGLVRLPQVPQSKSSYHHLTYLYQSKHVFSHRIWNMNVYSGNNLDFDTPKWKWIKIEKLDDYSWASAHKKILQKEKLLPKK